MKTVSYIRVSSKEQNLQRQLDEMKKLGIEDKYIYEDKASGKDMDRIGYQYMKKSLESGDTLVIKSLDRLGRNQNDIKTEWQYFKDNKINIRVLDMPALNIDYSKGEAIEGLHSMISNIVFEVISWQAEEERTRIKQRQAEGIESAKKQGKHLGRPQLNLNTLDKGTREKLVNNYQAWKKKKITGVQFAKLLDLKKNSFYKIIKEYQSISLQKLKEIEDIEEADGSGTSSSDDIVVNFSIHKTDTMEDKSESYITKNYELQDHHYDRFCNECGESVTFDAEECGYCGGQTFEVMDLNDL